MSSSELLRRRAAELALDVMTEESHQDFVEAIEFTLGNERYAFPADRVSEVSPLFDLTPISCDRPCIAGIVGVRGRIVVVVDLKELLDLPGEGIVDTHQVLLVRSGSMVVGVLADLVVGRVSIARRALETSLPTLTGLKKDSLIGVSEDGLVLLDAERILNDPAIVVDDSPGK